MDIDNIVQQLLYGTLTETPSVEFLKGFPQDLSRLAKIIAGMANTEGGYILLGVSKHAHGVKVIGLDLKNTEYLNHLKRLNYFLTNVTYEIEEIGIANSKIVIISVKKSDYTVYVRNQQNSERLFKYIRIGGITKVPSADNDKEYAKLYSRVFKYMNLEVFLCSLYKKNIRFSEPSSWPDKFESRFYCANYNNIVGHEIAQKIYATCITRTRNNEAAWKVYARKDGIAAHCVQLEINIVELRNQLQNTNYHFEEKDMVYTSEHYILGLHKRESMDYSLYFTPFTRSRYLKLLTLKRDAYQYENEIRIFAIPNEFGERETNPQKATCIYLPLEWNKIIKSIRVDKKCTPGELISIIQACHFVGINPILKNVELLTELPSCSDSIDVPLELFDIDEMPDSGQIIIEK